MAIRTALIRNPAELPMEMTGTEESKTIPGRTCGEANLI